MQGQRDEGETRRPAALVLNRDLLFGSRIRAALAALGMTAQTAGDAGGFVGALAANPAGYEIGIVDMNGAVDWDVLARGLQSGIGFPPILAFGPHTDVENRRAAKAAGVARIVSNGQFHQDAATLIERYRRR